MTARTPDRGLGVTGLSCALSCLPRGVPVAVADSRTEPPGLALNAEFPDCGVSRSFR